MTTYKKKFYFLTGGILLLLILSYHLSVKKTFTEISRYYELKEKEISITGLGNELQKWNALNATLDAELGGQVFLKGFQENLLHEVGRFCNANHLTLVEFSEPFEGKDGEYTVETIILNVKGSFKPLLRLVHHLENSFHGGRIASVEFTKEKNFRSGREELFLKLYIQKIKKKEDEEN